MKTKLMPSNLPIKRVQSSSNVMNMILLSLHFSTYTWTFLIQAYEYLQKNQLCNSAVKKEMTIGFIWSKVGQSSGYWHWTPSKMRQLHVPSVTVVRHLSTDLYICKFSKGHGVSIMEMDAKSPAPQLWMPFSWSDIACGRWTSSSPHLFVWLSAAKHRPLLPHWCLPCTNHSSHFPAMQFSPSFVGFPSLLYSVPHCPLARGIWHQNDAVGLALSYLDMMSEVLLIVDISLQLFLTIFLLHSCNVVILVQYTWKLTFMKQRMKGYDFKNSWDSLIFLKVRHYFVHFCTFCTFVHCTLFWHFVCFL